MGSIASLWRHDAAAETAMKMKIARRLPRASANIRVEAINVYGTLMPYALSKNLRGCPCPPEMSC
jgi:hypothetical protein